MTTTNHANRGRGLESLLNYANEQYRAKGIATIQKIATPWVVIRQGNRITSAFPEGASTVDYMGDIDGESICFEAKQTQSEISFPLRNIEPHQMEFMRNWNGYKFFIIEWVHYNEIYRVAWETVALLWHEAENGKGKKTIPYKFMKHETLLKPGRGIMLDYLNGVV